jgi:hypothetical protein
MPTPPRRRARCSPRSWSRPRSTSPAAGGGLRPGEMMVRSSAPGRRRDPLGLGPGAARRAAQAPRRLVDRGADRPDLRRLRAAGHDRLAESWQGAVILMLAHAVAKAAMFLAAGRIAEEVGPRPDRELDRSHRPPDAGAVHLRACRDQPDRPAAERGLRRQVAADGGALAAGAWHWVAVAMAGTLLSVAYLSRPLPLPALRPAARPRWASIRAGRSPTCRPADARARGARPSASPPRRSSPHGAIGIPVRSAP